MNKFFFFKIFLFIINIKFYLKLNYQNYIMETEKIIWYILNIILIVYGIVLFIYGKCFAKRNDNYVKIIFKFIYKNYNEDFKFRNDSSISKNENINDFNYNPNEKLIKSI